MAQKVFGAWVKLFDHSGSKLSRVPHIDHFPRFTNNVCGFLKQSWTSQTYWLLKKHKGMLDDSTILFTSHKPLRRQAVTVEKDIPLEIDTGLLTVTDLNPADSESYKYVLQSTFLKFSITTCSSENLEEYLMSTARDGVQALIGSLFSLPTTSSADGPLAQLPPPTTQLPRAKPLPKPKPLTKWEKFARAKGISKTKKDKKTWDEEKQDWVNRWGWKGANKDKEVQWLTEVPANAGAWYSLDEGWPNLIAILVRCRLQPLHRRQKREKREDGQKRTSTQAKPCTSRG